MRKAMRLPAMLVVLVLILAACAAEDTATTTTAAETTTTAAETTTTEGTTDTTEAMMGATCDEPVTVGVITDLTGALAIYGAHINRAIPIGFAYATDSEPQSGAEQTYMVDDCEVRVSDPRRSVQRRVECNGCP